MNGDWCTWPEITIEGWYCMIHCTSSTSPKKRLPPQLVGESAGGA